MTPKVQRDNMTLFHQSKIEEERLTLLSTHQTNLGHSQTTYTALQYTVLQIYSNIFWDWKTITV